MEAPKKIKVIEKKCWTADINRKRMLSIITGILWLVSGIVIGVCISIVLPGKDGYSIVAMCPIFYGLIRLIGGIFI